MEQPTKDSIPDATPETPVTPVTAAPEAVENSTPEAVEDVAPEVVEEAAPEAVEDPTAEVVEDAAPEVVEEATPEAAEDAAPEVAEEAAPEVVEEATPEVVEEATPEVAEEVAPAVVEDPTPEVVKEVTPEVVEKVTPEPAVAEIVDAAPGFEQFGLSKPIFKVLDDVGYETPSPIQEKTIPLLLEGKDVLGQAQTGTGKTAAFALPLLSKLDLKQKDPQIFVLAPTRELAIQVAEAFQKYAKHLKGFHVLPVYGGQDYRSQIRALQRGVHVVVGTPGRVMDHMRRGTLKLGSLKALVLDEADEMLRMGFIDDVEWILEQTPDDRQTALFSATLPQQIRRIASKYLNDPVGITIKVKTATADTIRQRFLLVSHVHKLEALTRILEAESFEAMIIFVRTKTATAELAERLQARGYASAPLNGDIQQNQRERTIKALKAGKLDILVATDVAARGLDVERISHVVNFDIPHDTEAYVHRIGRTGRAGREGDAILFVTHREQRMLRSIERATRKSIEPLEMPSTEAINDRRIAKFKQRITDTLEIGKLGLFPELIEQYCAEHGLPAVDVAAALAQIVQGDEPFLLKHHQDRGSRGDRGGDQIQQAPPAAGMERYRLEVGHQHGVKPGNIVGAIANEAEIDSQHIGRVNIFDDHTMVDLPEDMPKEIFKLLKSVRVGGQRLHISKAGKGDHSGGSGKRHHGAQHGRNPGKPRFHKGGSGKPKKKFR